MGSSPLARGTRYDMVFTPPKSGLIPARAGNTPRVPLRRAQCRAHPRSRGEHRGNPSINFSRVGSSPLARGTHEWTSSSGRPGGLIPARAGNTAWLPTQTASTWAHPRSRGEHGWGGYDSGATPGSSPLARGTPPFCGVAKMRAGLIPARAGNTGTGVSDPAGNGAHPRSRGEHLVPSMPELERRGSSPLARGTQSGTLSALGAQGLIPARAGNTKWVLQTVVNDGAHPRSRGEHACINSPHE